MASMDDLFAKYGLVKLISSNKWVNAINSAFFNILSVVDKFSGLSIIAGTITSLPAGSTPTAFVTGTIPTLTLNLGIPSGATGVQGPAGTQGIAGVNGKGILSSIITPVIVSGSLLSLGSYTTTVTMSGALVGSHSVHVAPMADPGALIMTYAWVSAANTVTIRITNLSLLAKSANSINWMLTLMPAI